MKDLDPAQRALGDAAVNEALRLRPDLPEVHLAAAFHLYKCYRDYERASVQVAMAQRTLPSSPVALSVNAYVDRRKGRWEESTKYLERALSLDPRNPEFIKQLAVNYSILRRNRDFEQTFDRIIELEPDQPLLKLEKAILLVWAKADLTSCLAALDGVPASMKDNQIVARWRFDYAVLDRDWTRAKAVLSDSSNEEFPFSDVDAVVPRGCLQIWLARVQGDRPAMESDFAVAHDQLMRKVDSRPENGALLSALGLIDAALGRKQEAINEAKRAAEMLPISVDAYDGPSFVYNLAAVYALTNEANLAFDQLAILVKTPGGVGYGQLKLDPAWDPLRKDPRFDKLLAELAPRD